MILLPTLNRTTLLSEFIKSYIETKATVDVVVLIDSADLEANLHAYEAIKESMPKSFSFVNTGDAISMGDKIRFYWPTVQGLKPNWIGLLNDDHYCVTPEWDKKSEAMLDGTNMVSTNDGNWNFGFNVVGLTAWSYPLLEAAGFPIFPGKLHHYYIDNVWKSIGEATGCWLETNKINIEHRHVWCGKMPQDATFTKVNNPQDTEYNRKEFEHFMAQDFQSVCERITKLRTEHLLKAKFL